MREDSFIYRERTSPEQREKQFLLRQNYPKMSQRKLSGMVSRMWRNESPIIRGKYESISLMLAINKNRNTRRSVGPMDFENGSTHFFVLENCSSTSNDDEFINSIFDFDAYTQ
ncbi:23769_t:CDS:2 [Gigaspora margarita]|uniref:23769_t:CDS:1 n=1 Tax=Gigaspora margarita TaxID=4874 RepID=A0ABM8W092_GIGMA|nr:23769_t:CDS:2 [Gigaspora margarita]